LSKLENYQLVAALPIMPQGHPGLNSYNNLMLFRIAFVAVFEVACNFSHYQLRLFVFEIGNFSHKVFSLLILQSHYLFTVPANKSFAFFADPITKNFFV